MNELGNRARKGLTAAALSLDAFYHSIFSQPDFLVYVIRALPDGTFLFEDANAGVSELAGRPLDEVIGARPRDCLPPEIAECLETHLAQCTETREPLTYERAMDMPDGRLSWKTSLLPVAEPHGPIRHVVGLTRDVTFERGLLGIADHSQALIKGLGEALPNVIYLFDVKMRGVRFVAGQLSRPLGYAPSEIASMGHKMLPRLLHPDDRVRVEAHLAELQGLPDGEIISVTYRMRHRNGRYRHYLSRDIVFSRDPAGKVELILGVAEDITDQDRMEEEVKQLSSKLLTLQIEERRRIAQELHDSTAQHLTAAGLALSRLWINMPELAPEDSQAGLMARALHDAELSLREAKQEIRVLSYLLHPPLIESHGLRKTMLNFCIGFGERAGLEVDVRIGEGTDLINDEMSVALFRVCQEALANVHRHAKATKVVVGLEVGKKAVQLSVRDNGIGFDKEKLADGARDGVGLSGMRERMQRLGGTIELRGKGRGTNLVASVPLPDEVRG